MKYSKRYEYSSTAVDFTRFFNKFPSYLYFPFSNRIFCTVVHFYNSVTQCTKMYELPLLLTPCVVPLYREDILLGVFTVDVFDKFLRYFTRSVRYFIILPRDGARHERLHLAPTNEEAACAW